MGIFRLSVINQMLKDLDQRQDKQVSEQSGIALPLAGNSSSKKIVLITLTIIILLNVTGLFFWQLYSENQSLKALQKKLSSQISIPAKHLIAPPIKRSNEIEASILEREISKTERAATISEEAKVADKKKRLTPVTSNVNNLKSVGTNENSHNDKTLIKSGTIIEKKLAEKNQAKNLIPTERQRTVSPKTPTSLSISRRQMSPQDLANQKYSRAEQAILDEEITQAEQLFEEILLLQPSHKAARKQLAALWFGRQSYQPALNLLSQGLALTPQDNEYRLMKARIYLSQEQAERALETLLPLADYPNVEYQALLANTAQQQGQFVSAITAYQQLVNLQSNKGRWWLGLAIAFDSNSQFLKAAQAYQMAIAQQNLSPSSAEFSRKRLIELGE